MFFLLGERVKTGEKENRDEVGGALMPQRGGQEDFSFVAEETIEEEIGLFLGPWRRLSC